jgi:hypothetical protein
MMDDIEDRKTYVAEYFSWKVPRHGEAVFTKLEDAEKLLFKVYVESLPISVQPSERRDGSTVAFKPICCSFVPWAEVGRRGCTGRSVGRV